MAAAITPFKVIQGHRFWYQSIAHMRLSNLPPILHRFRDIAFARRPILPLFLLRTTCCRKFVDCYVTVLSLNNVKMHSRSTSLYEFLGHDSDAFWVYRNVFHFSLHGAKRSSGPNIGDEPQRPNAGYGTGHN